MTDQSAPADRPAPDLRAELALERIEVNLFRGVSPKNEGPRIFGGLVIGQALAAAYATIDDKLCHSLHAYFIRPGDVSVPVLYEVDRSRDGGSFSTRRVVAIQHGEQIFNLAASFQRPEEGFEHQLPMPAAPEPLSVPTEADRFQAMADRLPKRVLANATRPRAIEVRWVDPQDPVHPIPKPAHKQVWMRAVQPIGDDQPMHQQMLAYASDMAFMETAMRVHGLIWWSPGMQTASLDHAMWFHRPIDFNQWHLYDTDSPSTSGGRGLVRGAFYDQNGTLVASAAQDCLIRQRPVEMR